jgi:hypothetical protein
MASACLATGTLSPVSADSSTSSCTASSRRPSAGMRSPASTATTSPGTSSSVGTVRSSPSRRTRALVTTIDRSASSDASARDSMTKPMMLLRTTTASTTSGVFSSPETAKLTAAATSSTTVSSSRSWAASRFHAGSRGASGSWLGPWRTRRSVASVPLRPSPGIDAEPGSDLLGGQAVQRRVGRSGGRLGWRGQG